MKAIGKITFEDASDANIKRENANIDGNTAMGTMLQYGSTVSKTGKNIVLFDKTTAHPVGAIEDYRIL